MAAWYRAAASDYLKAAAKLPSSSGRRRILERRALILYAKADKLFMAAILDDEYTPMPRRAS